ncbi:unnamed protein product [Periconia digitata]|uniref:Uncharacterized protein n=1 Tax=Periconia digitata TaxID=1303443 RepID=A0A9W4XSR1_9PLEO|nr:unnamed protein product [Periconia digitata]
MVHFYRRSYNKQSKGSTCIVTRRSCGTRLHSFLGSEPRIRYVVVILSLYPTYSTISYQLHFWFM